MRRLVVLVACIGVVCTVMVGTVFAQAGPPWRIVQGSDGTLYLITGTTRYEVTPDSISDDDLAALQDGGPIAGSQLPQPPALPAAPTPVVPPPAPQPPAPAPPAPQPRQPITVTGSNSQNGQPFQLAGGNFAVTYTLTNNDASISPNLYANLTPVGPGLTGQQIVYLIFSGKQTLSGHSQLTNIQAGQYQVTLNTWGPHVDWSCMLTPS